MRRGRCAGMCLLIVVAVTTIAARAGAATQTRFVGTCQFTGTDAFSPPLTLVPARGVASATAVGHCSGTLTDAAGTRRVQHLGANYTARATSAAISCAGGVGTGSGELTVGTATIGFTFTEPQLTALSVLSLHGRAGGSAVGAATVTGPGNPVDLAASCLAGGIGQVPIALNLTSLVGISG